MYKFLKKRKSNLINLLSSSKLLLVLSALAGDVEKTGFVGFSNIEAGDFLPKLWLVVVVSGLTRNAGFMPGDFIGVGMILLEGVIILASEGTSETL